MAFYICRLFLFAADLTLASAISCVLYALTCLCLGSAVSLLMLLCSLGVARAVRAMIGRTGGAALRVASRCTLGQMLWRRTSEEAELGVVVAAHGGPVPTEEGASATQRAPLPGVQKNPQLPLKGSSGVIKKPSILAWEEEKDTLKEDEGRMPRKQKNSFLSPACLLALLWAPVDLVCPCLKKTRYRLLSTLLKSQD
ncbi:hypothetical protein JRQ81_006009 [Phrynocephalus forsythii]|uniref:Uncharacterized protein n=1 Tax=Phrynocephalus forsythii TaxID=171643 RepID=A0A9Q1B710_9SAUR|nr:hypothetical protein JRQ81_006009 [Phrynocephalus forsythii]